MLATHTGSLIRPPEILEFAGARQKGETVDEQAYNRCLKDSVAQVVRQQVQAGVDVVNDGESGKSTSWSLYALKRLSGFALRPTQPGANPFARGAERPLFKEFYADLEEHGDKKTWSVVTQRDAVATSTI